MILHTVSIWYTLVLAVWRLIMIKYHTKAVTYCTLSRCNTLLVLGYGISQNIQNIIFLSSLFQLFLWCWPYPIPWPCQSRAWPPPPAGGTTSPSTPSQCVNFKASRLQISFIIKVESTGNVSQPPAIQTQCLALQLLPEAGPLHPPDHHHLPPQQGPNTSMEQRKRWLTTISFFSSLVKEFHTV